MSPSIQTMTDFVRIIVISHVGVLILLLLKGINRDKHVIIGILFSASLIGYLLVDWMGFPQNFFFYLFLIGAVSLPFCFWLFSKSLFDDHFKLQRRYVWIWLAVLAIRFTVNYLNDLTLLANGLVVFLKAAPQLVSLAFVMLGIGEALKNAEADLLPNRARFRMIFIVTTAVLITLTLFSEIIFNRQQTPPELNLAQKALIGVIVFYFSLSRLEFKTGFFREKEKEAEPFDEVDQPSLAKLLQLIEKEKLYRTEGLTIRRLADLMEVKEYKLRRLINQHLGFRNFNDFLHSYRIQEACAILADPTKKHLAVLEIAYELGYQSLAPFNKAFRDITDTTPTAYRKEKLQEK